MAKTEKKAQKVEESAEVKNAKEVLAKAKAVEKLAAASAVAQAADKAAAQIPGMTGEHEIVYNKAGELKRWSENPRQVAPDPVADEILAESLAQGWSVQFPCIIFETLDVIQGNRRLALVDPDTMVPCVVYRGDTAGAFLLALQDTGTGIQRKGLGDLTRTTIRLMRDYGLSAHTLAAYLWRRGRELLIELSPTVAKAKSVEEAQLASRGKLQGIERIGRLEPQIQAEIIAELNDQTRKGKVFNGKVISDLLSAKSLAEREAIIEARKTELAAAESGEAEAKAPDRLTAKIMVDRKNSFNSKLFQNLAALFDKAEGERNAVQLLTELDATAAMRE